MAKQYRTIYRAEITGNNREIVQPIKYRTNKSDKKILGVLVSPAAQASEISLAFKNRAAQVFHDYTFTSSKKGTNTAPDDRDYIFPVPITGAGTVITGTIKTTLKAGTKQKFSIYILTEGDATD